MGVQSQILNNNQPNQKVVFDGLECELNEEGQWLYKASPFKIHKPNQSEQPHYPVVSDLESKYSDILDERLTEALKDIVRYLNVS